MGYTEHGLTGETVVGAARAKEVISVQQRLEACEEKIERCLNDAWHALREIHDEGLYEAEGYKSFKEYCEQRWGYSKTHAYRLIDHTRIVDHFRSKGIEILPTNDAQTRELSKLRRKSKTDEEFLSRAEEAWQIAVDTAPKKLDVPQVTAEHVQSSMGHFGITSNMKKPDAAELEDFRKRIAALADCRFVKRMTGDKFVGKHGAKALGNRYKALLEWLIDADQAAMEES